MDFTTIIGLIGTFVTFEEAGRGWFPIIKNQKAKNTIELGNWDSKDSTVQHVLDSFKSDVRAEYKEHIFSEVEINEIANKFLNEKSYLNLSYEDRKKVTVFIQDILGKYNEYTRSLMSTGENVLYEKLVSDNNEIKNMLSDMANKVNKDNLAEFYEAVETSKSIGLANIDCLINDEYEIDRTAIVEKIKKENEHFISIQGCAGSGKSVIGKKLVENESLILYARAEKFVQEKKISDIWHCNLDEVLNELAEHKVVFFIDALEFIADCTVEKIELLQSLYNTAGKYDNKYVITTCRTEDRNAFLKLQTKYSIKTYEIEDISSGELNGICKKYSIIKKMREQKAYADLLKSPFYINLIVCKMPNSHNMQDENEFRNYIWRNIICLEDKAAKFDVSSDEIQDTIENISFTRAKKFLIGVHRSEIKKEILHILITEGIVIQKGEYVRLKYDIFEDICFEYYFDKFFDKCKGNFRLFFENIESIGRCVYRRYQIWISNKLFLKRNREKFIYELIFSEHIAEKWKNQTEIGIVKSKYCSDFFEEYFQDLVDKGIISEIISIINLYAFEAQIIENDSVAISLYVKPVGKARECIISLLHRNWNDFKTVLNKTGVLRLCEDYAKQRNKNKSAALAACEIVEYYIEQIINNREEGWYYKTKDTLVQLLKIVYWMSDVSDEWIKKFFEILILYCKSENHRENRWASEIMEETLKNAYPLLARTLPKELCSLANNLWFRDNENWKGYQDYACYEVNEDSSYGLSEYANNYNMSRDGLYKNLFLWNIFTEQFRIGFNWAIKFINRAIQNYVDNEPEYAYKVSIYFTDENKCREYYGNPKMWLAGVQEHQLPLVISDILYVLKSVLIKTIKEYADNKEDIEALAEMVKREIYAKSNNIALFTIIEAIGMNFQRELPAYALDLVTSLELLYWDSHRYGLYIKNPAKELLLKQVLQTIGVPSLNERYQLDEKCNINLKQYAIQAQLLHGGEVCNKCSKICDYMYSQTSNEGEEAQDYLQIQKMDLRNASIREVSEDTYAIEPKITGEAGKIVQHQEAVNAQSPMKRIDELVARNAGIIKDGKADYKALNEVLDLIIEIVEKDEINRINYENVMEQFIAISLSDKEMSGTRREYLCDIWINGIEKYFNNGTFVADNSMVYILWMQLQIDISIQSKNRIKKLLLDCLLYRGQNGLISKIASQAKLYLQNNKSLAKVMFNTIVMLAEDEMQHQVYNANYVKNSGKEPNFEFHPNKQLKLSGVDHWIKQENAIPYVSKYDEIIENYLFKEKEREEKSFDISKYDIETLCFISNCGLDFSDKIFEAVIRDIIYCLIDLWDFDRSRRQAYRIVDVFHEHEIVELFQREIVHKNENAEKAIDLLFDNIDFSLFTSETIEFYQDIFGDFVCTYFDAYSDKDKRRLLENKILYLDSKVNHIKSDYVRIQLYKSLMFSLTRYCHGDWSKAKTKYSYSNKMFLNSQFKKYGKYHVEDLLQTIYQLRMEELLPHILISLNEVFAEAIHEDKVKFAKSITEVQWILDMLVLKAFVYQSDDIKNDDELTRAFEGVLQSMVELDNPKAAVILDEFRIH